MQRYYGADLTGLWRGELTLRKLRVYLEHLPVDSATAHAVSGSTGPLAAWTLTDALLGRLVDEVAAQRWQWESAHSKNGRAGRRPPESVLPDPRANTHDTSTGGDVVPLVSPHRLGEFVYDQEEEGA